jgi:SIR2-like protein
MSHYDDVISAIDQGEVVPFLGAGVNLFGREEQEEYSPGTYLPSGRELATFLAGAYRYPLSDKKDLLRVSQYASVMRGMGSLYNRLGQVFDANYPTTELHKFFARLPKLLQKKNRKQPYQLLVTTNYDDVLERAFQEEQEPYDLVTYVAKNPNRGKFRHLPHGAAPRTSIVIPDPNTYKDLPFKGLNLQRTVILKIHGAVDRVEDRLNSRPDELEDSFVITEDDYINYLAQTDISKLLPVQLSNKLIYSGFLFLGYGLRDWNLRVIMNRIWGERQLDYASWAIQLHAEELDQKFWGTRGVNLIEERLETYIVELQKRL